MQTFFLSDKLLHSLNIFLVIFSLPTHLSTLEFMETSLKIFIHVIQTIAKVQFLDQEWTVSYLFPLSENQDCSLFIAVEGRGGRLDPRAWPLQDKQYSRGTNTICSWRVDPPKLTWREGTLLLPSLPLCVSQPRGNVCWDSGSSMPHGQPSHCWGNGCSILSSTMASVMTPETWSSIC